MSTPSTSIPHDPEPTWAIAKLFPPQGHWTEGNYLSLTESLSQLVELVDGHIEVLEMPTKLLEGFAVEVMSVLDAAKA